jgi:hypothetical protein
MHNGVSAASFACLRVHDDKTMQDWRPRVLASSQQEEWSTDSPWSFAVLATIHHVHDLVPLMH